MESENRRANIGSLTGCVTLSKCLVLHVALIEPVPVHCPEYCQPLLLFTEFHDSSHLCPSFLCFIFTFREWWGSGKWEREQTGQGLRNFTTHHQGWPRQAWEIWLFQFSGIGCLMDSKNYAIQAFSLENSQPGGLQCRWWFLLDASMLDFLFPIQRVFSISLWAPWGK